MILFNLMLIDLGAHFVPKRPSKRLTWLDTSSLILENVLTFVKFVWKHLVEKTISIGICQSHIILQTVVEFDLFFVKLKIYMKYYYFRFTCILLSIVKLQNVPIVRGVDRYACPFCPMELRTSTLINRHMLTHSGEKPHLCQYCNKSFNRKDSRDRHMAKTHKLLLWFLQTDFGQLPSIKMPTVPTFSGQFKCPICKKFLRSTYDLDQHILLVHSRDKPWFME